MSENNIESWVKKAIRGNVDAYGHLVEIYKTYLYRTAWLYVHNEDVALDVVQERYSQRLSADKDTEESEIF